MPHPDVGVPNALSGVRSSAVWYVWRRYRIGLTNTTAIEMPHTSDRKYQSSTLASLAIAAILGLACGGGPMAPPPPVALDGCGAWDPPAVTPVGAPTLAEVIDHTPGDFVGGVRTTRIEVQLGDRKADLPQIRIIDDAVSADTVFNSAAPVHADGGEPLFLLLHASAHTGGHSLLGRNAFVTITLGDAVVTFSNDGGHVDKYLSVPGVALHKGDPIRYDIAGGRILTSTVAGHLDTTWQGEFPVVLGDDRDGLEVRAVTGAALDALIATRLSAFDQAFPKACAGAVIDPEATVPAWDPYVGVLNDHREDVAAIVGWTDPRLKARLDRLDRVSASWHASLAELEAASEPGAARAGEPVAFANEAFSIATGELRVAKAAACAPSTDEYCPTRCVGALSFGGEVSKHLAEVLSDQVVVRAGAVGQITVDEAKAGATLPFAVCFDAPPADDDPILYRPYHADRWLRLR